MDISINYNKFAFSTPSMKNLFFLFFFFFTIFFYAQNTEPKKDVKVGLVLSGGGAKGFAHVGALKVIEESGVRIDYIAGTSMGSIIGGLYAAGYSAKELDSILRSYDMPELLQDKLPRSASNFYQKENEGKYSVILPIKKGKIGLPSSISKGQSIFDLFSRLTEHVHEIEDFEKLPIPFFCIATDLETGEEVVLDKGFLPEAIRASGSFPSFLAPVVIDGRVLVDGGLRDNYPIEKLKEKGVDYIIGVDVQGNLHKIDDLETAPEVLMQIAGYQMYQDIEKKVAMTDVYIKPDISNYNDFSFDKAIELVDVGEKGAKNHIAGLENLAARQTIKRHHNSISSFKIEDTFFIKEITFQGNDHYTDEYCLKKLGIRPGEYTTHHDFYQGVNALSASKNFKSITYKFVKEDGGIKIEFALREETASSFVKLGLHYDDLYKSGVLINFTKKYAFFNNDFLSADVVVGDNFRFNLDYFIDNGFNWSFGVNSRYNTFEKSFFVEDAPPTREDELFQVKVPVQYNDFTTRLYFQTTLKNKAALRLGVENKLLRVYTSELVEGESQKLFFEDNNYLNLFGQLTFDSYDVQFFPKKGFFFNTNYIVYLLSSDKYNNFDSFSLLYGRLGYAYTFIDRLTLHLISEGGITIGSSNNQIFDYFLGGNNENFVNTFVPFYGYEIADLSGPGFLRSALTIRYELFKNQFVSFTGNFARTDDDLWNKGRIFQDTRSGYAFGYGINTFLGPIQLKYAWSPDNKENFWYFNLGYWF